MENVKDWAALVTEFHDAQGQRPAPLPDARLPSEVLLVRLRLMHEELYEYILAMQEYASAEIVADSICDLLYVVVGTAVAHGMGPVLDELFREVHRSNMTKDFKPIGNGEKGGFKGDKFTPPLLGAILRKGGR
jgi:predicted HAD superfamily Cof-like phosphohydrolase